MRVAPISYAQKFIYRVMERLGPHANRLQLPTSLHISGPIDIERFRRAATELMALHPILCARLDIVDGELVQRSGEQQVSFEVVELPGGTGRQVDAILSARANDLFDLFHGCPFRVVLVVTGPDEGYLLLVGHHMFVDVPGLRLALRDYLDLYERSATAGGARIRSDKDYFDYAVQEAQMIRDGTFASMIDYWTDKLAQADPGLHLPGRSADPLQQSPEWLPFTVDQDSFTAFTARAGRLHVSPFALVACASFSALREVSPQDDLMLSVVTNTRRPPFRQTVGTFARTFPIRQQYRNGGMGEPAVRLVFQDIITAMRNNVPIPHFSSEIDWLRMRHEKGYAMNDAFINYLPYSPAPTSMSKVGCNDFSPFSLTPRAQPAGLPYEGVVLGFTISQEKDSLSGALQYETAIVSADTARAITSSWIKALTG